LSFDGQQFVLTWVGDEPQRVQVTRVRVNDVDAGGPAVDGMAQDIAADVARGVV
jgi:hypothetical protein